MKKWVRAPGSTLRLMGVGVVLAALTGCGSGGGMPPLPAATCFSGTGLERALGPGVGPAAPAPTLILDSLVDPVGERRHARVAAGAMARAGYWLPGKGDTLDVVVSGIFPPALFSLHPEANGLAGTGRPVPGMTGSEADTTSWAVALTSTPCAPALAALEPGGPPLPFPVRLSKELAAMGDSDQAVRRGVTGRTVADTAFVHHMTLTDSVQSARLEVILRRWGWPSPSRAGETAANAAFLVLQHSPSAEFQRRMMPTLDSLATVGEMNGQSAAVLTDRVLKRQGLPQRYGSQFDMSRGTFVLDPIEDSANVDTRRATMGLMPLEAYIRLVQQMYHISPGR